jgi:hypothetical protein
MLHGVRKYVYNHPGACPDVERVDVVGLLNRLRVVQSGARIPTESKSLSLYQNPTGRYCGPPKVLFMG